PELEMDLRLDAYLPAEYIRNEQAKIEIYKKLRATETIDQLMDVKDELLDRFNDYPKEVAQLLDSVEIKVHLLNVGVQYVKDKGKTVEVVLTEQGTNRIDGEALFKNTEALGRSMKVGVEAGCMKVTLTKGAQWLESLKYLAKTMEESLKLDYVD
ncbi:transcription-repair coupling factor, partial [Staphylococcus equorum]